MTRRTRARALRDRLQDARGDVAEARELFGELGELLEALGLGPVRAPRSTVGQVAPAEALHAKQGRVWREVSSGVFVAEPE